MNSLGALFLALCFQSTIGSNHHFLIFLSLVLNQKFAKDGFFRSCCAFINIVASTASRIPEACQGAGLGHFNPRPALLPTQRPEPSPGSFRCALSPRQSSPRDRLARCRPPGRQRRIVCLPEQYFIFNVGISCRQELTNAGRPVLARKKIQIPLTFVSRTLGTGQFVPTHAPHGIFRKM
jgi:hypothetical protein